MWVTLMCFSGEKYMKRTTDVPGI